jgi:type VI protein secretion system component VasK
MEFVVFCLTALVVLIVLAWLVLGVAYALYALPVIVVLFLVWVLIKVVQTDVFETIVMVMSFIGGGAWLIWQISRLVEKIRFSPEERAERAAQSKARREELAQKYQQMKAERDAGEKREPSERDS